MPPAISGTQCGKLLKSDRVQDLVDYVHATLAEIQGSSEENPSQISSDIANSVAKVTQYVSKNHSEGLSFRKRQRAEV